MSTPDADDRPKSVYLDHDQAGLDAQYNNRARFPDGKEHFDHWNAWSGATRARVPCPLDVAFGKADLEKLDIFPAAGAGSSIYVFIHGGYWYSLDKSHYSFVAEGMLPHGVTTVVNNFELAPAADMDTIVEQNRRALVWIWWWERHWAALGHPVELVVPPGLDHFNVVNDLADPACWLVTHQLGRMRLAFEGR